MFGGARRRRAGLVALLVLAAGVTVATWPARRLIGINFVVTEHTLPLWMKTVDFVDRDLNLARTAREVLGAIDGDEARTMTALAWTREHVRPQPAGLPVVDDHVWYIVVRGYGEADQRSDVFTTLLAYEGVPAYWMLTGTAPDELPVSYVKIGGRWRVFDAASGIVFRTTSGELAAPEDLIADPELVRRAADGQVTDLTFYLGYFRGYRVPEPPDVLRADLQMSGRRTLYEMKRLIGRGGRVWQIRQVPAPAAHRTLH